MLEKNKLKICGFSPFCFFHVWSHMHHGKKGSGAITRYPDTSSDMCTQNCTHCRRREKERGKRKNFLSFPNPLFPHFCNNPSSPHPLRSQEKEEKRIVFVRLRPCRKDTNREPFLLMSNGPRMSPNHHRLRVGLGEDFMEYYSV